MVYNYKLTEEFFKGLLYLREILSYMKLFQMINEWKNTTSDFKSLIFK